MWTGSTNHKYVKREWKNGRWVYYYPDDIKRQQQKNEKPNLYNQTIGAAKHLSNSKKYAKESQKFADKQRELYDDSRRNNNQGSRTALNVASKAAGDNSVRSMQKSREERDIYNNTALGKADKAVREAANKASRTAKNAGKTVYDNTVGAAKHLSNSKKYAKESQTSADRQREWNDHSKRNNNEVSRRALNVAAKAAGENSVKSMQKSRQEYNAYEKTVLGKADKAVRKASRDAEKAVRQASRDVYETNKALSRSVKRTIKKDSKEAKRRINKARNWIEKRMRG